MNQVVRLLVKSNNLGFIHVVTFCKNFQQVFLRFFHNILIGVTNYGFTKSFSQEIFYYQFSIRNPANHFIFNVLRNPVNNNPYWL